VTAVPQEMLRHLAENGRHSFDDLAGLAGRPELLLDLIFLPRGIDAPDPQVVAEARESIPRLGVESYAERERASRELRGLGTAASEVLKDGLESRDPEIRYRCGRLLGELSGRKPLADLDYGNVQQGIGRIVAQVKRGEVLVALAEGGLQRMGPPTVHGREAYLLKPVFAALAKSGEAAAPGIVTAALTGASDELATAVAAAVGEAAGDTILSPAYLAALGVSRAETLDALLTRSPGLTEPVAEDLVKRYRDGLEEIAASAALPLEVRLKARRLLLVGFFDATSLQVLIDSARGRESPVTELALRDPRLTGIPLEGAEAAAGLIGHGNPQLREAAGWFLLTRPEQDLQVRGLDFLPHLGATALASIKQHFAGPQDAGGLRAELEKRVAAKAKDWEMAERLLQALPEGKDLLPRFGEPFGFR
jgi:hypothetical protein